VQTEREIRVNRGRYVKIIALLTVTLALGGLLVAIQAYRGTLTGEQHNPSGTFSLRYYQSFNPFKTEWSMPGGSACKPFWIRLYSKDGEKLNELYTTNCRMEMDPLWSENEVFLPDGVTVWKLPAHIGNR
jgi:hypothetical protein